MKDPVQVGKPGPDADRPLVLIIEDDRDIRELLHYHLEREGFVVIGVDDGETGIEEAVRRRPSLILLDLMLPRIQGLDVCRILRQRPETRSIPLIMLTARGEESDVVVGLAMGADDYVSKPFSVRELVARVKAVVRRSTLAENPRVGGHFGSGPLEVDVSRHEVTVHGRPVDLTPTEFRILATLASFPGRVFTREQLLDRITQGRTVIVDRNVDVHIRSIRRKLGAEGLRILTVRGVGYKLGEGTSEP